MPKYGKHLKNYHTLRKRTKYYKPLASYTDTVAQYYYLNADGMGRGTPNFLEVRGPYI